MTKKNASWPETKYCAAPKKTRSDLSKVEGVTWGESQDVIGLTSQFQEKTWDEGEKN